MKVICQYKCNNIIAYYNHHLSVGLEESYKQYYKYADIVPWAEG